MNRCCSNAIRREVLDTPQTTRPWVPTGMRVTCHTCTRVWVRAETGRGWPRWVVVEEPEPELPSIATEMALAPECLSGCQYARDVGTGDRAACDQQCLYR